MPLVMQCSGCGRVYLEFTPCQRCFPDVGNYDRVPGPRETQPAASGEASPRGAPSPRARRRAGHTHIKRSKQ